MTHIRKIEFSGKMSRPWFKIGNNWETPGVLPLEIATNWLYSERANGFVGYLEHLSKEETYEINVRQSK